ncbi:MAG: agmatine deiminase family protein [Tannerella sp.]|jgi:agmatine/peptidylarginine deiminase|nr:agmatine deiminase family protein [Tannerella sp.]
MFLPAEWHKQVAVQLTWPHSQTDWKPYLVEAQQCFDAIAHEVLKHEKLIIVAPDTGILRSRFSDDEMKNIYFFDCNTNDTWARDHGGITVFDNDKTVICDFVFNGWGLKFPANFDNRLTMKMMSAGFFSFLTSFNICYTFVLEGGSIESDGCGTLMTTASCLLAANRNDFRDTAVAEKYLCEWFGLQRVMWLHHGYLAGDDTDGHIDTLARFCDKDTIAYVKCYDVEDEHFSELQKMEDELKSFKTLDGKPYRLMPLPLPPAMYYDDERLPATYANFLIINGAVLVPFYGCQSDEVAAATLQTAFPDREIVGIDCKVLLRQHGSLHCVTMQYSDILKYRDYDS